MKKDSLRFIDLFAGLGGFHVALSRLGCKCVFASEIRPDLQRLYKINYGDDVWVEGDITKVNLEDIPQHDILCAGFPCQPFSQAGKRQGFDDEEGRGNLFNWICKVIEAQKENKPEFLLLENVANLRGHDHGNTWRVIQEKLSALDYDVDAEILSPHQFGYPQHRKRIYIVGRLRSKGGLNSFHFPLQMENVKCDIRSIIDEEDEDIQVLKPETIHQLKIWQMFLDNIKKSGAIVPKFPIWAMEFGANYPFEVCAPAYLPANKLKGSHGNLGKTIKGETTTECVSQLPIYAQTNKDHVFPKWKISYISQNRLFYELNKDWIEEWKKNIEGFSNSHQKFEWNCSAEEPLKIRPHIVQFRASGIRVKDSTFSPALNLVGTQIPIFPWIKLPKNKIPKYSKEIMEKYRLTPKDLKYGRYMSVKEAARIQGMEDLQFGNDEFRLSNTRIYEALGNAVNTQVVEKIARILLIEQL